MDNKHKHMGMRLYSHMLHGKDETICHTQPTAPIYRKVTFFSTLTGQ